MEGIVLITGANGFIGSFIIEEALKKSYKVLAAVRNTAKKLAIENTAIEKVTLSFGDKDLMTKQLKAIIEQYGKIDYVIHNAGITQANNTAEFHKINAQAAFDFAQALIDAKIPLKKFVLISSLAAYGPGNQLFEPIQPNSKYAPISAYGSSKMEAEKLIKQLPNLPYIFINPTAVYGPRDKDFFEFIQLVNKGWEINLGWHKQVVSMIYVKDLAKAIIGLMGSTAMHKSFFVSDGQAYPKKVLGTTVKNILGKKTISLTIPLTPVLAIVKTIDWFYALFGKRAFLNAEKLKEISSANWHCNSRNTWETIGSNPDYLLEKGLSEAITWYKNNRWL